jgi:hypothetical protein
MKEGPHRIGGHAVAIDVVRISSAALVTKATACMIGEHLSHGQLHQKFMEHIKAADKAGIGTRDLSRKVQRQAKQTKSRECWHSSSRAGP